MRNSDQMTIRKTYPTLFLRRDWVTLNYTRAISHSPRPMAAGCTRKFEIMESPLTVSHRRYNLYRWWRGPIIESPLLIVFLNVPDYHFAWEDYPVVVVVDLKPQHFEHMRRAVIGWHHDLADLVFLLEVGHIELGFDQLELLCFNKL